MDISEDTRKTLTGLTEFSGNKIKNPDDIAYLIEISHTTNQRAYLNNLMFTAKYLNGLGKILHTGITNIKANKNNSQAKETMERDSINKIRNEYKINLEKFLIQFEEIVKSSAGDEYLNFKNKYLASTQISMINITNLIYDLSWLKKYYNQNK